MLARVRLSLSLSLSLSLTCSLLTAYYVLLQERVSLARLPEDALEALWACYHEALAPLQAAGRLGVVMMQAPSLRPSSRHPVTLT